MIEQALVNYLNSFPAVVTAMGGMKVYYHRAPAKSADGNDLKMPWAVITNSGGMRERDTQVSTEPRDTISIYVDAVSSVSGLTIAETIRAALENYRGDMAPERDLHIRCGTTRDLDGYQGSCKFLVTAYVRYRQTTAFPN